ncbi:MAG: DNA adenine methylase [Candidatus ainarchaeum sp.]|nr:DNA adenine methylase [Candidatus ainarchaeum sp.]
MTKPFVKWAGGKNQLLKEISNEFPKEINNYYEPFVGGGAVLFYILERYKPKKVLISDTNEELINAYLMIKKNANELMIQLDKYKKKHSEKFYYSLRGLETPTTKKLGLVLSDFKYKLDDIERAAKFIYLNKTCFNGLYRVNRDNKFNVPMGKYKNPEVYNKKNILELSKLLQNVDIKVMSFEEIIKYPKEKDFIYFDPPYDQLNESSFTSYTCIDFTRKDQVKLKEVFDKLNKKGCLILESNSSTKFMKELYRGYKIKEVLAKRLINCDGTKRNDVKEILIKNY